MNENFPSVRIFIFRKTTKFLFALQARQLDYILLQRVLDCTLFSCIWIAFWSQIPNGGAYSVYANMLNFIFTDNFDFFWTNLPKKEIL